MARTKQVNNENGAVLARGLPSWSRSFYPPLFNNDISTIIDDRPVEDYISEGEDRPGEGIHF